MDEERETVMEDLGNRTRQLYQNTQARIYPLKKSDNAVYNGSRNLNSLPEGLVRVRLNLTGETKIMREDFANDLIRRGKAMKDNDQTKH